MCLLPQGMMTFYEPGLPNIHGKFIQDGGGDWAVDASFEDGTPNAIFVLIGEVSGNTSYPGGATDTLYGFNAARSSLVYKDNCKTVQPPATTVNYFIKAR